MKIEDITVNPEGIDWQSCLQHWSWLLKKMPEFNIWLVTKFGEIFVVADSGEVWFLSTSNASYEKVANSQQEFWSLLIDPEELNYYFMSGVLNLLHESGFLLEQGQCFGFHVPCVFEECKFEVKNFKCIGIESYLIGLGDMLGKLVDSANGEKIRFKPAS
jgi:hypothetical protein